MKYAFALGRLPALSVAELVRAINGLSIESVTDSVAIGNCPDLPPGFINLLGGTIKIIAVDAEMKSTDGINADVLRNFLPPREGRMIFGISIYGHMPGQERRILYIEGLNLKKKIKEEGRRCRYVVSKDTQLSSVVVAKNKLIAEGAEFVIIKEKNRVVLGHTIAVQEFEAYGERDFDRPGRSARRGMLPPKLSQMMVNIARGDRNLPLLDPFCGSGTILGEALLMGYTQVIGADVSAEAISDTKAYLEWLEKTRPEFRGRWRLINSDARLLNRTLNAGSVGAIATEPYLGPPQSGRETPDQLKKIMNDELIPLYRDSITALAELIAPSGSAVFSLPVFNRQKSAIFTPLDKICDKLIPAPLVPGEYVDLNLPTTSSGGALYERPDQFVAREIVLLKKA